jgi:hypothetical protein
MEMDRIRILETLPMKQKTMDRIKTKTAGFKPVRTIIKQGNPAEEVLDTAKK